MHDTFFWQELGLNANGGLKTSIEWDRSLHFSRLPSYTDYSIRKGLLYNNMQILVLNGMSSLSSLWVTFLNVPRNH